MSALSRLSSGVTRLGIAGMVVGSILVYGLRLGDWTLLGVRIYYLLVFSALAALLSRFLDDLIFAPGLSGQVATLAKQTISLTDVVEVPAKRAAFASEVIDAVDAREKMANRLSAILGVVCYFVLGPRIGSPVSEFVALAVLLFLPPILAIPTTGQLGRMRALDPSMFDIAYDLYSSLHIGISNGEVK